MPRSNVAARAAKAAEQAIEPMATPIPSNRAELTARSAAAATGGQVIRSRDVAARGIVSDTRAISGGEAFVALRGATHDGHAFVGQAAARGASLLVVESSESLPDGPDVVRVVDTLAAWGDLAAAHLGAWRRARPDRRVVAITGSAGKTTTKQLCAALLAEVAGTWATPGNLNNLVGLPAVVFALEDAHRFAVLEAGMSLRGEMARLGAIARPDVAVVTNIATAHAEGVGGTRADVAREKGALFEAVGQGGTCVFDAGDDVSRAELARARGARAVGFGRDERADYRLLDRVSRGEEGSRVTLQRPCELCASPRATEIVEVELPLLGEAAAVDLCAALAAAEAALGASLPVDAFERAMRRVRNVEGRAELRKLGGDVLVVDDTYNANPASMRAAFSILSDLARAGARRTVAILGEMKELGAAARDEHAALGDALCEVGVSLVIGCGGLSDLTVARARELGVEAIAAGDVAAAAARAVERVRPGDVVLVKASRSVGAEDVVEALVRSRGDTTSGERSQLGH